MATKADALAMPVDLRVRTPMLDGSGWSGSGRALTVGDRVGLLDDLSRRGAVSSINRLDWTLTVQGHDAALDPDRVVLLPGRTNRDECGFLLCDATGHQVHAPGCPHGDGLEGFDVHRARELVEIVATDGGRYPQDLGHYDTWTFGTVRHDLVSKGGLQARQGERVLTAPPDPHWFLSGPRTTTFFSLRRGVNCSAFTYDIERED